MCPAGFHICTSSESAARPRALCSRLLWSPRTVEISWLKLMFYELDVWTQQVLHLPRRMGGFFCAISKAISVSSLQYEDYVHPLVSFCMLDGSSLSLLGLHHKFHNTPLAVVSPLNSPQSYKQLKTCNQHRVQQLWQWIKYKALGL